VLFAYIGVSDFAAASISEPLSSRYWRTQVPVRLLFLSTLTIVIYFAQSFAGPSIVDAKGWEASPSGMVRNSVMMSWSFLEWLMWVWVSVMVWGGRVLAQCNQANKGANKRRDKLYSSSSSSPSSCLLTMDLDIQIFYTLRSERRTAGMQELARQGVRP